MKNETIHNVGNIYVNTKTNEFHQLVAKPSITIGKFCLSIVNMRTGIACKCKALVQVQTTNLSRNQMLTLNDNFGLFELAIPVGKFTNIDINYETLEEPEDTEDTAWSF